MVDQHVPPRAAGEAFGWLSTALDGGTGGASVLAAALAAHDARVAFLVAAVAGLGAAAVTLAGRGILDSAAAGGAV